MLHLGTSIYVVFLLAWPLQLIVAYTHRSSINLNRNYFRLGDKNEDRASDHEVSSFSYDSKKIRNFSIIAHIGTSLHH